MLKIMDTFEQIKSFKQHVLNDDKDILVYWKEYLSKFNELRDKCVNDASSYHFDQDIKPILINALTTDYYKLELAHKHFLKLVSQLINRFQEIFEIDEDIYMYFYIGLCNGAGWATQINNDQVVLLGAEKIVELNWHDEKSMMGLIYHELCHVAHSLLRNHSLNIELSAQSIKNIWQLYIEGFAQRYEQILFNDDIYHQDINGWLSWCKDNHSEICKEYLERIMNGTHTQCFFGDWTNYKGYSDVGYYLGCEFIKHLRRYYSTLEIAAMKMGTIETEVIDYLKREI